MAIFTVCDNAEDVLTLKFGSPPYDAVIECEPAINVEVLKVAFPLASVPVPSVALPSLNVTRPVAVESVTVAVNFTDEP